MTTFSFHRSPLIFSYNFGTSTISRVYDYVMYLGLKPSYNLDPGPHINYVCMKALKILGLIIKLAKNSSHFRLQNYNFIFLPDSFLNMDYSVLVWDP